MIKRGFKINTRFFIIYSLSRCGSSALYRALNSHSEINCLYEPDFSFANWNKSLVKRKIDRIRLKYSGIKHVWDPSGFPFVNTHLSVIREMNANYDNVLEMNLSLLSAPNKRVIFLRRRNQLTRILSDLLGQQTDVWTPAFPEFPDATIQDVVDEANQYRGKVKSKTIRPVPMDLIEWYLDHVQNMEESLRKNIADDKCLDLFYEDLFNLEASPQQKIANYKNILDFLGYPSDPSYWDSSSITALFDPRAKLNNSSTFSLIPNIEEIQNRWGNVL